MNTTRNQKLLLGLGILLAVCTVLEQSRAQSSKAGLASPAPTPSLNAERPLRPAPAPLGELRGSNGDPDGSSASFGGFGGAGGTYGTGYGSRTLRTGNSADAVPPVVVQFSAGETNASQQMEEDLSVMSHIFDQALEKGLGEEIPPSRMGVPLLYTSSGRSTRALYLDGFGALFMIKVNMPLLPPPPAPDEKQSQNAADSEWESARREVLGVPRNAMPISVVVPDVQFDPDQFEALKRTLISALRNAANIRNLKPTDAVSVAVFGQPAPQAPVTGIATVETRVAHDQAADASNGGTKSNSSTKSSKGSRRSANKIVVNTVGGDALQAASAARGTVLTIRASVADINALAQEKLPFEEFQKKVTTASYAGSGYGVTSVNSWISSGRAGR